MKRRNFVNKTAVGVIGFNLFKPDFTSPHLFQTAVVHQWLQQLVSATSAKRKSGFFLPQELSALVNSVNSLFSKQGFLSRNSAFYFYNDTDNYCFYALELNHSKAGLTDVVLPVLHRESNGSWRHITTINGYQLEALARASHGIRDHADTLQQILLPSFKPKGTNYYHGFPTKNGSIDIVTRIFVGKSTETTISLVDADKVLYNDIFISGHCLTCSQIQA